MVEDIVGLGAELQIPRLRSAQREILLECYVPIGEPRTNQAVGNLVAIHIFRPFSIASGCGINKASRVKPMVAGRIGQIAIADLTRQVARAVIGAASVACGRKWGTGGPSSNSAEQPSAQNRVWYCTPVPANNSLPANRQSVSVTCC